MLLVLIVESLRKSKLNNIGMEEQEQYRLITDPWPHLIAKKKHQIKQNLV